jgi:hypothetical protein
MSLETDLEFHRAELLKLCTLNNDLIDQLRHCESEIKKQDRPDQSLNLTKNTILNALQEHDFPTKIAKLTEKIKQIEIELYGYVRTGGNSPF